MGLWVWLPRIMWAYWLRELSSGCCAQPSRIYRVATIIVGTMLVGPSLWDLISIPRSTELSLSWLYQLVVPPVCCYNKVVVLFRFGRCIAWLSTLCVKSSGLLVPSVMDKFGSLTLYSRPVHIILENLNSLNC